MYTIYLNVNRIKIYILAFVYKYFYNFFSKYKYRNINYIKSINYINVILIIMRTFTVPVNMCAYVCVWHQPSYFSRGSISTHPHIISLFQKTSIPRPLTNTQRQKILLNGSHFHATRHTNLDICLRAFKVISKPSMHFSMTLHL